MYIQTTAEYLTERGWQQISGGHLFVKEIKLDDYPSNNIEVEAYQDNNGFILCATNFSYLRDDFKVDFKSLIQASVNEMLRRLEHNYRDFDLVYIQPCIFMSHGTTSLGFVETLEEYTLTNEELVRSPKYAYDVCFKRQNLHYDSLFKIVQFFETDFPGLLEFNREQFQLKKFQDAEERLHNSIWFLN